MEGNIKVDVEEIGWDGVESVQMVNGTETWRVL